MHGQKPEHVVEVVLTSRHDGAVGVASIVHRPIPPSQNGPAANVMERGRALDLRATLRRIHSIDAGEGGLCGLNVARPRRHSPGADVRVPEMPITFMATEVENVVHPTLTVGAFGRCGSSSG